MIQTQAIIIIINTFDFNYEHLKKYMAKLSKNDMLESRHQFFIYVYLTVQI